MQIGIIEPLYKAVGAAVWKKHSFIQTDEAFKWEKVIDIDLFRLSLDRIKKLRELIAPHEEIRGTKTVLRDIDTWVAALGNQTVKPRTMQHFYALLRERLRDTMGHRIYERDRDRGVHFCYYVESIEYHPKTNTERGGVIPAHTTMDLFYIEFGRQHSTRHSFWPEDVLQKTVDEALLEKGEWEPETPALRAKYLEENATFNKYYNQVGLQFFARGTATDDLDGNQKNREGWWYSRTNTIRLDRNGEPSRVVIDVFRETDKEERNRDEYLDKWFWSRETENKNKWRQQQDENAEDEVFEATGEEVELDLPVHPMCACFDLKRHTRLRIHIAQLTLYDYDEKLGEKLVLPVQSRALVEMLLQHQGGFSDIIKGKGEGAIILCAGGPGTGKTLTAEVYAEVMSRPLYSVQCSQLGTDPDDLEDELLKVFARSQRWHAILLLDEADVYVAARGTNLQQNAIVGVFLRTLEYYKGVMFLTTNRAELIDDAIASRCIARIDYHTPERSDQIKIWGILSETAGIKLHEDVIQAIVRSHPGLTGRDIKNLLKLAYMVSSAQGSPISPKLISFVKQFKPTSDTTERIGRKARTLKKDTAEVVS